MAGRGRPRNANAAAPQSSAKKRGRPPKNPATGGEEGRPTRSTRASNAGVKKRGRPPTKGVPTAKASKSKSKVQSGWAAMSVERQQQWRKQITGIYNIKCPIAEKEWPEQAEGTIMRLHIDGETIWGEFDSGCYDGYIRFDSVASSAIPGSKMRFAWKGTDSAGCPDTGEGELILSESHGVEGAFFGMYGERFEFQGPRKFMPCVSGRPSDFYKLKWRYFEDECPKHWY